ncbi:hypothetical protein Ctob_013763 [Chrysochromulina tobinii]|uniref:Uncharacterized protein n=1 Tax=Chrysochromulina tobinii TaxID=1460289 RepID=A0A0M0K197_9EUKA|nr:hypothetical protein Ctob_013763 [Chrysochromulina tobinii]|eukprot:KOO32367.1 hypothetical protein Ctob_013763 [Chrysochromulina sp. CCMP291]
MFIDMLVKYDFAVVVVCIGLAASKKLYPALKSRRDIIVTCTYHAVLLINLQLAAQEWKTWVMNNETRKKGTMVAIVKTYMAEKKAEREARHAARNAA